MWILPKLGAEHSTLVDAEGDPLEGQLHEVDVVWAQRLVFLLRCHIECTSLRPSGCAHICERHPRLGMARNSR